MRVLITGADGFVGRHVVARLRPHHDVLTTRFDVADAAVTSATVAEARPDAVIHLAAVSALGDARRDPNRTWDVNLHGALGLARAVLDHAPQARLLFVGTGEAYGASFRPGTPLDETAPLAPQNTYGAAKAAADLAMGAMAAEGLRVVRLRPLNHTGPGQTDNFVVPAFARQITRIAAGQQDPVMKVGRLDPERDFLDVRDVAAAYEACLTADLEPGTILNIASGQPRRIGDILDTMLALAGIRPEVQADAARIRPADIPRAVCDAGRARTLLRWTPAIPWEQTLREVLADWSDRIRA